MNFSNESTAVPTQHNNDLDNIIGYMAYTIIGFTVGGTNLCVVFLIVRFKALRRSKEYLVVMSLSLADGCNMMAYVIAGIRRTYVVYTGEHKVLKYPLECALVSHNLIWSFAEMLSGLVLLIVSIDRLLAIAFPFRYLTWSIKYVLILFGSAYLYCLTTGTLVGLLYLYALRDQAKRTMIGYDIYYATYRTYGGVIFALFSIVVYAFVWILYNRHQNRVSAKDDDDQQQKVRLGRQRRLTKSLGISCVCTIFVYMIPFGSAYFLKGILPRYIRMGMFVFSTLNPLCNIFIYYYRQPEMKQALIAMFTGKTMPATLTAWKMNNQAKTNMNKRINEKVNGGYGPNQGQGQPAGTSRGQGQEAGTSRGQGQQAGTSRGQGQQAGTSRGQGQQAGTSRGQGQQAGTSRGQGQQAGTSRGQGQQAGTSRGQGQQAETSRGQGQQAGTSRGQGQQAGTSRGQGKQAGTSRGQGQQAGTSRGQRQQAGTSRGQGQKGKTSRGQGQKGGTSREQGKQFTNRFGTTITTHGNASNCVDET